MVKKGLEEESVDEFVVECKVVDGTEVVSGRGLVVALSSSHRHCEQHASKQKTCWPCACKEEDACVGQ